VAIRLYEGRMEFDYDSSDGTVKTTHTVYIESDGLWFDGTIYGTGAPGVFVDSTVSSDSSGLSTGDFEFQPNQIAFGSNTLYAKSDGSGVVFSGTIGATLDSVEGPAVQGYIATFISGGIDATPTYHSQIDKFPFSISSGTATDVGDLSEVKMLFSSYSSNTDAFTSGGFQPPRVTTIDKFPFNISSGTATDVGDLSAANNGAAGSYSNTDGFVSGGQAPGANQTNTIEKFPFSISSGTSADVGDLSLARNGVGGHQD